MPSHQRIYLLLALLFCTGRCQRVMQILGICVRFSLVRNNDVRWTDILSIIGRIEIVPRPNRGSVEGYSGIQTLGPSERHKIRLEMTFGPIATDPSAPSLTLFASSESTPLAVMIKMTASDDCAPAWRPKLAADAS
jgi:hypothetical protein